jgi:hypothetical protein
LNIPGGRFGESTAGSSKRKTNIEIAVAGGVETDIKANLRGAMPHKSSWDML